ncbi:MAG: hypothetical protein IT435_15895 [Phycisphaerales bacterium]|nr:hypothetical protein [Phycisphaerales bacterium]
MMRTTIAAALSCLPLAGCTATYPTHDYRDVSIIDSNPKRYDGFRVAFEGMPSGITTTEAGNEFVLFTDFAVTGWGLPVYVVVPWHSSKLVAGDRYTSIIGIVRAASDGGQGVHRWYLLAVGIHSAEGDEYNPEYESYFWSWRKGATTDAVR